eukprot:scaffold116616_cov16-Tisochrysis_lutea.AAC.1
MDGVVFLGNQLMMCIIRGKPVCFRNYIHAKERPVLMWHALFLPCRHKLGGYFLGEQCICLCALANAGKQAARAGVACPLPSLQSACTGVSTFVCVHLWRNGRQSGGPRWSGMPCAFRAETDGSGLGRPSFPNLATGATGGLNGGGSSGGFSGGVGLGGGSSSSASLRQPMRFVSAGLMVESGDLDGNEEGGVQVIGGGRPEGVKDNGRQ